MRIVLFIFCIAILFSCKQEAPYDTIIRNAMIYDGNGGEPYKADIAINADTIAFIGDLKNTAAKNEIDAKGMAVAPRFIYILILSNGKFIQDGRSPSELPHGRTF